MHECVNVRIPAVSACVALVSPGVTRPLPTAAGPTAGLPASLLLSMLTDSVFELLCITSSALARLCLASSCLASAFLFCPVLNIESLA